MGESFTRRTLHGKRAHRTGAVVRRILRRHAQTVEALHSCGLLVSKFDGCGDVGRRSSRGGAAHDGVQARVCQALLVARASGRVRVLAHELVVFVHSQSVSP